MHVIQYTMHGNVTVNENTPDSQRVPALPGGQMHRKVAMSSMHVLP
jgi:hypothetical protein